MILLAGIVLIAWAMPLIVLMGLGAYDFGRAIYIVVSTLVRFLWHLSDRPSVPAPPNKTGRKATKTTPKPDAELIKIRQMAKTWKTSGSRVGLVNLDSGEVYEPASSPEQGG